MLLPRRLSKSSAADLLYVGKGQHKREERKHKVASLFFLLSADIYGKTSCLKPKGLELRYLVYLIFLWSSTKIVQIMLLGSTLALPY